MNIDVNVSGTKIELHKRIIQMPNIFKDTQVKYLANPYWEPEKNPIMAREFEMAIAHILKIHPFLKSNVHLIKKNIDYDISETTISFYIELI